MCNVDPVTNYNGEANMADQSNAPDQDLKRKGSAQVSLAVEHPIPLIPNAKIRYVNLNTETDHKVAGQPVYDLNMMSLLFLFVFLVSLKGESVITKIARLKEPNLSEEAVIYTRNLTKIWCGFFAMNAMIAYTLSLMDDKIYWSFYSGAISYILIAALFGGEILYRKTVLKV